MILSMHCTWNIQEMILVISMQQCYIDVYKSHLENDIIYAMYKKYSVNDIKVVIYMFCLFMVDNPVHNRWKYSGSCV